MSNKVTSKCFSFDVFKKVQVSNVIGGGYVPDKSQIANTKTGILGLYNYLRLISVKNCSFPSLFAVFESVNSQNRE